MTLHTALTLALGIASIVQTAILWFAEGKIKEQTVRAETAEASVLSLTQERDSLSAALEDQRKTLELVQSERNKANAKISTLLRTDPETRNWADVPVPPALLGVFK